MNFGPQRREESQRRILKAFQMSHHCLSPLHTTASRHFTPRSLPHVTPLPLPTLHQGLFPMSHYCLSPCHTTVSPHATLLSLPMSHYCLSPLHTTVSPHFTPLSLPTSHHCLSPLHEMFSPQLKQLPCSFYTKCITYF